MTLTPPTPLPLVEQFQYGLDAPICLTWELTYACNLSCIHCLSSSGRRDPRELSTAECKALIDGYAATKKKTAEMETAEEARRYPVLGAFDLCLKCSHLFNILDARGAISVTERVGVIARIRALAVGVAKAYLDQQQGSVREAAA